MIHFIYNYIFEFILFLFLPMIFITVHTIWYMVFKESGGNKSPLPKLYMKWYDKQLNRFDNSVFIPLGATIFYWGILLVLFLCGYTLYTIYNGLMFGKYTIEFCIASIITYLYAFPCILWFLRRNLRKRQIFFNRLKK